MSVGPTRTVRQALTMAMAGELRASKETVFLGETVRARGSSGVAEGLYAEFGDEQVIETPVSENGVFGAVLGLALGGMRPIVEIYSADFLLAVANELINDIAKWRHQHRTPTDLPITIRGCMGATGGRGPEHSQCIEAYFHHAPGLTIVTSSTPADAIGLLRSAIRAPDPVLVLEHRRVYDVAGPTPEDSDFVIPLGRAAVVREGEDVTLLAWAWMRHEAERAAATLAEEGISVELIDLRTVRPVDWRTVFDSVQKTRCVVVAEESPRTGNVGAEIIARAVEKVPGVIAGRVSMPDALHPYSATMEAEILPDASSIALGVRDVVSVKSREKRAMRRGEI